jgi:maltose alpha-D-glucosyltransferase/alpha-amylase
MTTLLRPSTRRVAVPELAPDPLWYKDAVIYQVHVRAFYDSNGDGIGDFRGLTAKLDYLAELGVTAVWLMPFYPSPGRDDGYDIADYVGVNPDYGTLADVRRFVREAHRRGIRVIGELVCNHTSDQHPWFQRARRAPKGSAARNFYVWSDTPDRYREARIIFRDFESSNWSWDPVAGQYYWHRFYHHQPDLNYDNPRVREAIFRVMDFWLELGIDGLRLDAVPYLFEREGTNCENLPETHAFLKALRAHIDERFADRMLLAEANQWPDDAVAYFGAGDECHMAFHFPIMPRLFMALRMEDRYPIVDILEQTPPIPETAQWALFLRNHDELTLEMVTDEERDYMYRVYASDPQARINLGIRRRLAPLVGNNRRRIELLNGLLFSLPGTPVVYYGDEIGMGDNVYLGDRNGVRTPMQWSPDRNAGFSTANRQRLYLPVIVDPEYHYEAVNVAAQQANPHSLLWWMRRLIALRKRHPAFGRGSFEVVGADNRKVFAFLRRTTDETILVVANLSRYAQWARLDLAAEAGLVPVELFGNVEFPPIGEAPYGLSLGPHSFLWFRLDAPRPSEFVPLRGREPATLAAPPDLARLLSGTTAERLTAILLDWLPERRWFRSKARRIRSGRIADVVELGGASSSAVLVLLDVTYDEGEPERYAIPLEIVSGEAAAERAERAPGSIVARLRPPEEPETDGGSSAAEAGETLLVDAAYGAAVADVLLAAITGRRRFRGRSGAVAGQPTRAFRALRGPTSERLAATPLRAEQSNTSLVFDDRFILKLYRVLEAGENPDLEIGRFLTERRFPNVPAVAGFLDYRSGDGPPSTLGVLQAYVPNEGDLWAVTLDAVDAFYEAALAEPETPVLDEPTTGALLEASRDDPPEAAHRLVGAYLDTARLLGERLGELHTVLASEPDDPAFAPEPLTPFHQRALYQSVRGAVREALRLLERERTRLPERLEPTVAGLLAAGARIDARLRPLVDRPLGGMRIRCHGDFHAGQVLFTGRDVVIIDFEGEPARPLSERRLKRPAFVDVAGMVRSFHYAAHHPLVAGGEPIGRGEAERAKLRAWARFWYGSVAAAFLRGYGEATAGASFLPPDDASRAILLDALLVAKAAYELRYELNNRPGWVEIPLVGLAALLGGA